MNFLSPKGLRAEVTEGIDLESGIDLSGDRISIGSSASDDLRLGALDVVPGHLTLQRRSDGKGWEYFTSDRGATLLDKGNPRTGTVRPGMWFQLGSETRLDILRTSTPESPTSPARGNTVPLTVALPVLGLLLLAFGFALIGKTSRSEDGSGLRTEVWFTGASDLEPALMTCLQGTLRPDGLIAANAPDAAFWRYHSAVNKAGQTAQTAKNDILRSVHGLLAESHLLVREGRYQAASESLRRIEYVLPVGLSACPILTATRFDLALLEVSAN